MLYCYACDECGKHYEKSNKIEHRDRSGKCPQCGSSNTKKIMSTPMFKTCGGGHPGNPIK